MACRRLEKPQIPEAKICLWEDLTYSGMDIIEQTTSLDELKEVLSQLVCDSIPRCDPRWQILLDLYVYTLEFARTHSFSKEQTSALFSITRRLHKAVTETSLGNVDECFQYFNQLVFCHSVRRPPFSIDLFNGEGVKLITDYVVDTYFRHLKLYKYCFTSQIRTDVTLDYIGMPETPPAVEEEVQELEEGWLEEEITQPIDDEAKGPPSTAGDLRSYIEGRVSERVGELRTSLEGQMRASEIQLGSRLTALERPGGRGGKSARGK